MPSIKANFALALRRILTDEGTGCDTFGPGELEAALRTGVDPERISFNGSTKDAELLERAIGAGVRITLDSVAELDRVHRGRRAAWSRWRRSGLPLRPLARARASRPTCSPTRCRSGSRPSATSPASRPSSCSRSTRPTVAAPELELRGLMVHIGRQGRDPAIWGALAALARRDDRPAERALGRLAPARARHRRRLPDPARPDGAASLDDDRPPAPSIERYAEAITGALRDGLAEAGVDASGIQLEVEPGRSLYADTGVHLATVRHVKHQDEPVPLRWVETDTSEIFVADVVFERNRWRALVGNRADAPRRPRPPTSSGSAATRHHRPRRRAARGRAPAMSSRCSTPAPTRTPTRSNFNALPRPATVLVNGAEAEVIKRAETIADVFARDLVPQRLRAGAGPNGAGPVARARPRLGQLLGPRSLARLLLRAARDPGDAPRRGRGRGGVSDHRHRGRRPLRRPRASATGGCSS